jgi:hypothetical protein
MMLGNSWEKKGRVFDKLDAADVVFFIFAVALLVIFYFAIGGTSEPQYIGCVSSGNGDLLCVFGSKENVVEFAGTVYGK